MVSRKLKTYRDNSATVVAAPKSNKKYYTELRIIEDSSHSTGDNVDGGDKSAAATKDDSSDSTGRLI